jgi:hypothetical protein
MDLIAGNWGLNGPQRATRAQPLRLYHGDFMQRHTVDLFETEYDGEGLEPMPARRWSEMAPLVPILAQRYRSHREWAAAFARAVLAPCANVREVAAATLASAVFFNRSNHFELRLLPREAQWSPAFSVTVADFDADGYDDLFLSQNFFALRNEQARLDAGRGLLLRGHGKGGLGALSGQESGLMIYGEQRASAVGDFDEDGRPDLIVTQNGSSTRLFRNNGQRSGLRVRLAGPDGNPNGVGASVRWVAGGNAGPAREIHAGSGWLSQDSPVVVMSHPGPTQASSELHIRWPGGRETRSTVPANALNVVVDASGNIRQP